jgi:non-specific serine/threonine protein kinase/serine/threonine-protein kinase
MSVDQMKAAETIFEELADLPTADRETRLTERCGGNERLRDFVKQLLAEHDQGLGEFMQSPPVEVTVEPDVESTGRVGHYQLLEKLGEGGFGEVHLAEQTEPIRRTVALKIIKLGMDTKQVVARFEAERQALALMDHPHIARVFEAGATEHGRPYFAMEHVPGIPITDYCDKHRLGMEQRLELFIHVCDAIQHAHQKGIIHRDLKPSNILIERFGDEHAPKVIDFGIAKAMGFSLTERTPVTEQGQLIGTPEYMSPEQAVMSALNVDTRADIYSLGVVLYELLAGALPFDPQTLRGRSFNEIQRIILEVEPPKPSTRLSTLDGEAAEDSESSVAAIAIRRRTDVRSLRRRLRGDLDWITMKAMDKDRERRYASVSGLAADVRRHLRHEPVLAGSPSAVYKLRKLIRRYRLGVTAAATIALVLIAGIAATTWQAIRATDAEHLAQDRWTEAEDARAAAAREAEIAQNVNEFLNEDLLAEIAPGRQGPEATMRQVLDTAAERIENDPVTRERFEGKPVVEAFIRTTLGESYQRLGEYDAAGPHLEKAVQLRRQALGDEDQATLRAVNKLAIIYWHQGHLEKAESLVLETLETRRRLFGPEHPDTLRSLHNLGLMYDDQGLYDKAEPIYVETLELSKRINGAEHKDTRHTMNNLALLYLSTGRYDHAERLFLETVEIDERVVGREDPETLATMHNLANVYAAQSRDGEAEQLLLETVGIRRRVLGNAHPQTLKSMNSLASVYYDQRRYEDAEPLYVETFEIRRRDLGEEHQSTLGAMNNLAMLRLDLGRPDEAEPMLRELIETSRRVLGDRHPIAVGATANLASMFLDQARYDDAEPLLVKTIEVGGRVFGPEHPNILMTRSDLAMAYAGQGRYGEAEDLYLETVEIQKRVLGAEHRETLRSMGNLMDFYVARERADDARSLVRDLTSAHRRRAERPTATAYDKIACASLLLTCEPADLRDPATALALAMEANNMTDRSDPQYLDTLSLAYHLTGDSATAIEIQKKAIALLPPDDSDLRAQLEDRLHDLESAQGVMAKD